MCEKCRKADRKLKTAIKDNTPYEEVGKFVRTEYRDTIDNCQG